jgi:hypothetical protein
MERLGTGWNAIYDGGMDRTFTPGVRLAGEFYAEAVRPLLEEEFPGLRYAAGLIGPGSEVLGFDTERSRDHDWGPRLQVFPGDERQAGAISAMLDRRLPSVFRGYPVSFPMTRDPDGLARVRVEVAGLGDWLGGRLGFDPVRAVTLEDWLATPSQRFAEITGGGVFHDEPGELSRVRAALEWYPHDVWLYVLRCQWARIGQEEAFPGRSAEVGDELGSAVVTARLARDLMRLWLLMNRRYPPYSKWLGTAFSRAPGAAELGASLTAALAATDWPGRERHLARAYVIVAGAHNELGLTEPLDTSTRGFYDRPYQVIGAERFAAALGAAIAGPLIRGLPPIGVADQFLDSTDALGDLRCPRAVVALANHYVT